MIFLLCSFWVPQKQTIPRVWSWSNQAENERSSGWVFSAFALYMPVHAKGSPREIYHKYHTCLHVFSLAVTAGMAG